MKSAALYIFFQTIVFQAVVPRTYPEDMFLPKSYSLFDNLRSIGKSEKDNNNQFVINFYRRKENFHELCFFWTKGIEEPSLNIFTFFVDIKIEKTC